MSCPIVSGVTKACRNTKGGLTTIYVTEHSNLVQSTITQASGIITNVATFLSTGKKFWTIEVDMNVGNEIETPVSDRATGTFAVQQALNFYIPKKQASVAQWVMTLAQNDLAFIVLDKNGYYRLLGQKYGMSMGASTAPSGTNMTGEQSGYVLSFAGEEPVFANEMSAALVAACLVAA
jgi:hypothetical protein